MNTRTVAAVASLLSLIPLQGSTHRAPTDTFGKPNAAVTLQYRAPAGRDNIHLTLERLGDDIVVLDDDHVVKQLPQAAVSAIDISGPDHIDTALTIDYAHGALAVPIDYHPGALGPQTDNELILQGGTSADVVHTPTGMHSGIIDIHDMPIRYSNLTPVTDTTPNVNYVFNASGCTTINIADGGAGKTTISGDCTEATTISNKTNVTINVNSSAATVTETVAAPETGLIQLDINGNVAGNVFNITPIAGVPVNVQGFVASPATDALTINVAGATNVAVTGNSDANGISGTYTFGNRADVVFEDMLTISPPLPPPPSIPALNQWGFLAVVVVMGGTGWLMARRRKAA
jgi:hypothetical protein